MKRTSVLLLILFFTIGFAQSKPITSVPFTVEKNGIYFYVKVNETDSLRFLFDTGADGSVINEQSLTKLKLTFDGKTLNQGANGVNDVESSSGNSMTFGSITKSEVLFTIIPFDTDRFDGVFGTDLMKGHIIEIDYNKQLLHFYPEEDKSIDFNGYTRMKLYTVNYPTAIKSSIIIGKKRYTGFFGLDSGADDALTMASPFVKEKDLANKLPRIGSASFQGSDGSVHELAIVLFPEIRLSDVHLYRVPGALSTAVEGIDATTELAGFYGNALLKKFNLILDYKNGVIYWKLNKNLYQDYFE